MRRLPLERYDEIVKKISEKRNDGKSISVKENFNRMLDRVENAGITLLTTKYCNESKMTGHLKEYNQEYGLIFEEVERKRERITFRVITKDYYEKITREAMAELLIKQEKNGNNEETS